MAIKTIRQLHPAVRDDIADLVTRRPLPGPQLDQIDPFLFLNHHGPQIYGPGNSGLPFGPHPHRGFETVTFILHGELMHRDSAGHESIIKEGGVQWMTAGRGLIHAELSPQEFKEQGGTLEILQLWVNLPARLKMTAPRYVGMQGEAIPVISTEDGLGAIHLVSGDLQGQEGAIEPLTEIFMSWMDLKAGARVTLPDLKDRKLFLYVINGVAIIDTQAVSAFNLVQFNDEGDTLDIVAETDARILFAHAEPLNEPVVSHGPFVMNTRQEISQAIQDYQVGRFE